MHIDVHRYWKTYKVLKCIVISIGNMYSYRGTTPKRTCVPFLTRSILLYLRKRFALHNGNKQYCITIIKGKTQNPTVISLAASAWTFE